MRLASLVEILYQLVHMSGLEIRSLAVLCIVYSIIIYLRTLENP